MTYEKMLEILNNITYKHGWDLQWERLPDGRLEMWWQFRARCTKTGLPGTALSRKWRTSQHMVEGELVQTAMLAALTAEEHEAREFFRYKGKRVFNPHISITRLLQVCEDEEVRG